MNAASDRNLLFGMIALDMDFISPEALIAAMNTWVADKSRPIGQILVASNALNQQRLDLLEHLVDEHILQHGNDVPQHLASLWTVRFGDRELEQIIDPDVRASLSLAARGGESLGHSPTQNTLPLSASYSSGIRTTPSRAPTEHVKHAQPQRVRFRYLRHWREGGLGKVSIAHDEELHREVALKEIKPQHASNQRSQERFLMEGEITGSLEHPGIVPVYGMGRYSDGRPYYAMRFVHGESLEEAIERFHHSQRNAPYHTGERAVEFRELLGRFITVCNAIAYAHSRGVLHRDLKPGNILLAKYGETLVVDWGLAKVAGQTDESNPSPEVAPLELQSVSGTAPTRYGSVIGTPGYMSPEQAQGRSDLIGPATDVYSLGATLYCLLTGVGPFMGTHLEAVLNNVRRGEFPRPRQVNPCVPRALESICLKAMSLPRENRYASASALADDLEHWLADEPVSAHHEGARERAVRWIRRHRGVAMASAVALIVIAAVSIVAAVIVNQQRQLADRLADDNGRLAMQERAARDQSDIAFREARDAVDDLFTKVSEDFLLNQPGMQGLRKELLQKTLDYYQRFLKQRADDPSVKEEFAATLFRAGRIVDELESPEKALPYFRQAGELQSQLLEKSPRDPKRMQALGDTQNSLGRSLHKSRQLDDALLAYQAGREVRQKLAELVPQNADHRRALANSTMNLGLVEKDRKQFDQAASAFEIAHQIREKLLAEGADSPKLQRELAMGSYNRALLELERGMAESAVGPLGDAIARFQHLQDRDPRDLNTQYLLAICFRLMADAKRESGAPAEASHRYEQARDAFNRLVDRNPDVSEYQVTLAGIYMNMARDQEPVAKVASYEQAQAILDPLVQRYPQNPRFRLDLALCLRRLALAQLPLGRRDAARKLLRSSIEHLKQLVTEFPAEPEFGRELEESTLELNKTFVDSIDTQNA